MKAKFLPLLLLAILLQVSMFSFANEMTSARRIKTNNKPVKTLFFILYSRYTF